MELTPKTKINDSVFTHLFGQKKYMRQLYLALHPGEDMQAISECKEDDILKDYLSEHESEVYDIMTTLFNQESITKQYGDERYQLGAQYGAQLGDAHRLVSDVDNIITTLGLSLPDACSAMRCSILDYQQAKQMLKDHGNLLT